MMSRGIRHAYTGCDWQAPPPLMTYDPAYQAAAWYPVNGNGFRDTMSAQHPGPVMVAIPSPAGNALGDDPTDPARQTYRRFTSSPGMMTGFHIRVTGKTRAEG